MYLSCCNITPPFCTNIADPTKGATSEKWGGMGGCDWQKHNYFAKTKLKIHAKQLKCITCPKICLWALLEMPYTAMEPIQNPMARSLSFTLGSCILDERESQIISMTLFLIA
jgi:hypothetical protein